MALTDKLTNQVFGLALMTVAAVVVLVVVLLLIDPAEAATFAVVAVVLGATTYIVWRFDKLWAVILGLLVALGAGSTVFYIAFGIFQPFSPLEFTAGLLLVFGFLFAVIGGVEALIRRRRGSAPGGERLRQAALALLGIGILVSVGGFLATRSSVDATDASGAVVVDMEDFTFAPEDVSVAGGDRLLVKNSDAFAHDFTLEEYDLYTYFGPGSEALVDVSQLPPGTYTYFCSLHTFEGEGMIGTLTVQS